MKKYFLLIACLITSICSYASFSISENGIRHIKTHESCQLTAYWDSNGYSIGWGHHSSDIKKGMKISQHKANELFNKDLKVAENAAKRLINSLPYKYQFSQNFYDGLVDLIYNCGEGNVKKSIFYNRLCKCRVSKGIMNKSDYDFSIVAVKNMNITCKGHIERRKKVYDLMRK